LEHRSRKATTDSLRKSRGVRRVRVESINELGEGCEIWWRSAVIGGWMMGRHSIQPTLSMPRLPVDRSGGIGGTEPSLYIGPGMRRPVGWRRGGDGCGTGPAGIPWRGTGRDGDGGSGAIHSGIAGADEEPARVQWVRGAPNTKTDAKPMPPMDLSSQRPPIRPGGCQREDTKCGGPVCEEC